MFPSKLTNLVELLHAAPVKVSINVCGSGSGVAHALTNVAGCSQTLHECIISYSREASINLLDYTPMSQFVSQRIARQLAQRAFRDCVAVEQSKRWAAQAAANAAAAADVPAAATEDPNREAVSIFGIGVTSAVHTSGTKRNPDNVHVSVWQWKDSQPVVDDFHLELADAYTRQEQDDEITNFVFYTIGQALCRLEKCGSLAELAARYGDQFTGDKVPEMPTLPATPTHKQTVLDHPVDAVPISLVLDGKTKKLLFNKYGDIRCDLEPYSTEGEDAPRRSTSRRKPPVRLLYPGSFNPLHYGHVELARAAATVVRRRMQGLAHGGPPCDVEPGCPEVDVTYEIGVKVVDKGDLDGEELTRRVKQFLARHQRVAVTSSRLFVEKAALFPGHGFIVGVDTARRILDPQYYGGTTEGMVQALLADIGGHECYFVVGGRKSSASSTDSAAREGGTWEDLSSLTVPPEVQHLFIGIPETEFRVDLSSTELRSQTAAAAHK